MYIFYLIGIASLTTLSSPHRGSPIADLINNSLTKQRSFFGFSSFQFSNLFEELGKTLNVDIGGMKNLTTEYMREFNDKVRNHQG
jgi:hypothetical protein